VFDDTGSLQVAGDGGGRGVHEETKECHVGTSTSTGWCTAVCWWGRRLCVLVGETAMCETVPGTGEVARFPVETLGTHKDGNTEHNVTSTARLCVLVGETAMCVGGGDGYVCWWARRLCVLVGETAMCVGGGDGYARSIVACRGKGRL
jgi:hypothetical protein